MGGFTTFAPAGSDVIGFTSSPFTIGGLGGISSTIDSPNTNPSQGSGHSTAGDIVSAIGNTIVGAIAVSRIPSQQIAKAGIVSTPQQTQLQTRQLDLQSNQQNLIMYAIIAAVIIALIMAFRHR